MAEAAKALQTSLDAAGPDAVKLLDHAIAAEGTRRHDAFLAGIDAYRHHPYRRVLPSVPVAWRQGTTRLLDYRHPDTAPDAPPVLVVPSLINRAYILDLSAKRSLMRYMADKGLAPFLVDWDAPGPEESRFTLTDYIAGRLEAALDKVVELTGRKPAVVGYCMGGLLALALAQRRPDSVSALVLLATPFEFMAGREANAAMMRALAAPLGGLIDANGTAPVDMLQSMFAGLDPGLAARKFMAFARLRRASARARDFVALEDWANDGVDLAGPVARECLFGWYGDNTPPLGRWMVGGTPIRPEEVAVPALLMIPHRDRIVPPMSALPLAERLRNAKLLMLSGGHVGMLTGPRAKTDVYGPLVRWLRRNIKP
ncbi:poly-beta-hydroxybutyrate polymerase [Paramagnetospirillum kuznetsovii]|uniref:Poly-beta-hydroxybutyrate polymerase n=1 Tax=Paramagnetospirillum kuznetsovii TaxID=2053833 RepID=A0A364P2C1_9PROT|nr:alpha/beta fold hydrolase [Paramagnetospirillum kuznetsovii]RAU23499.1 poly-beta-hydroxybutyrate polymerase [Paramagnetospirillum kuznetsovii]